jgi:hypothetical protein
VVAEQWVRVPIGVEADRWSTVGFERRVLVVARTATATAWILQLLPDLVADWRIQCVFSIPANASAFEDGPADLLTQLGARTIPWGQALASRFDAVVAASHNGDLEELRAPLFLTPHGPGYTKLTSLPASVERLGGDRGFPVLTALSHPAQSSFVEAAIPGSNVRTVVVGDPCLDQLVISESQRLRYRDQLGVSSGQQLVVISSTWGRSSLLGNRPDMIEAVVGDLPVDEFRVALIVHPNVWYGHGAWQVRTWLRAAVEAGLILVPPVPAETWRAVIVASDFVIGDHGSVTVYGAALGRGVLLAAFGDEELVPDTAVTVLGGDAPRFCDTVSVADQLRDLKPTVGLRELVAAFPGEALERLRVELYHSLRLSLPVTPPPKSRPAALAGVSVIWPAELAVRVVISGRRPLSAAVVRKPARLRQLTRESYDHLAVDDPEVSSRTAEIASVLIDRCSGGEDPHFWTRAKAVFACYPALAVHGTVVGDRCTVVLRDGRVLRGRTEDLDPAILASVVYRALVTGRLDDMVLEGVVITAGSSEATVSFTALDPEDPPGAQQVA